MKKKATTTKLFIVASFMHTKEERGEQDHKGGSTKT